MQTAAKTAPKAKNTRVIIGSFFIIAVLVRVLMDAPAHSRIGYSAAGGWGLVTCYNVFEILRRQSTVMVIPSILGTVAVVALIDDVFLRVLLIALIIACDLLLLPTWARRRNP
jgi:hypothetical protein